ncbi:putative inositol-polyphosphate 5-phosphatase [Helianthus debilis subsp. tardiflorus]
MFFFFCSFQEIIPFEAGYVIGSEDTRPIPIWENIIRKTLNNIQPTNFCFICTHLTAGERDIDIAKRNVDVQEIYKRTCFNSMSKDALPKSIIWIMSKFMLHYNTI